MLALRRERRADDGSLLPWGARGADEPGNMQASTSPAAFAWFPAASKDLRAGTCRARAARVTGTCRLLPGTADVDQHLAYSAATLPDDIETHSAPEKPCG